MRSIRPRLIASLLLAGALAAPVAFAQDRKDAERPARLTSAERRQADDLLARYIKNSDPGARKGIIEELAAIDHPSTADIRYFAPRCFARMRQSGPLQDPKGGVVTCTHPDHRGTYILQVPSQAQRRPTGVFISLHGGGQGVGDGRQIQSVFGTPGAGMINVYPTVTEQTTAAWNTEREERYVLAILDELKRTFVVDTDRVYLAGHSMGGFGTWSIGPRHADLFAAISPQAGGVFDRGTVFNLKNLPIWFYHSSDDPQVPSDQDERAAEQLAELKGTYGAYEYVWELFDNIGHGTRIADGGLNAIWTWMLARRRNPMPERVLWEPSREYKRSLYWVAKRGSLSGRIDVQRDKNRFTVTGSPSGVTIFLHPDMIDFDDPVVVVSDSGRELFQGTVHLSLVTMVETIAANNDPKMWFVAAVDLD